MESSDNQYRLVEPRTEFGMTLPRYLHRQIYRPWFAYLTLFLLALKVIWNIWKYRDLTTGDTASYFTMSYMWFKDLSDIIIWSPLYTAFYGTLLYFTTDAYVVTILHRVLIVLTLSIMVFALMRRLLPHGIAWLVAAWWVVLPINFDALYEVHLFAVIPVLASWLLLLSKPSPWSRGAALAILFASCILVRNELIVATGIFALICIVWENRLAKASRRLGQPVIPFLGSAVGYGVPLLIAALVVLFFYARSTLQFPILLAASAPKHTTNMCQVYAYGYQQRHPEWNKSPWTECSTLMEVDFGKPFPSLIEMINSNPRAVLEHFLWNISLTPNGLQILLFNAASGSVSPDYAPVQLQSPAALVLSIIVGSIIAIGLFLLYRERHYWWQYWLHDRALVWLAMFSVASTAAVIIPTQRPRPSYLFTLGIVIMAICGMCLFVIVHRWQGIRRATAWMPAIMIALLLVVPMYYTQPQHIRPRSFLTLYSRLAPFEQIIAKPDTVLLVNAYSHDVYGYIVRKQADVAGRNLTQVLDYSVLSQAPKERSLGEVLDLHGINMLYVDEHLWARLQSNPEDRTFLTAPETRGWQVLALQHTDDTKWMLLLRTK